MLPVSGTGESAILSLRKDLDDRSEEGKVSKAKETRRRYTEEFKSEAVQMMLDGHTVPSVMEQLAME